jgi:hypothetical protein
VTLRCIYLSPPLPPLPRVQSDPGVVGILLNALGKLAAQVDNQDAIAANGTVLVAAELLRGAGGDAMMADPRVLEGAAAVILPLSFQARG